VSVSASVTGNTNIKLTTDKTFENDKTTSLYLAIKSGDKETALSSTGAKVTDTIGAAPERSYSTSWDEESNKYVYALPDDTSTIEFAKYSFSLTGAANTNGDWSKIEESPAVSVTYTVVPHVDAYVSATTLSVGSESVTLSSLPEGVTIKSVVLNKTDGSTVTLTSGSTYTLSGSKLSIKAAMVSAYPGATVKVTYSDGHEDTLTIQ
jgi:ribosomal protein L2